MTAVGLDRRRTVFICFDEADRSRAIAVHRAFAASRMRPWCSALDLLPGDRWDRAIPRALANSIAVLVLVSDAWPAFGDAGEGWYAPDEVARAIDLARGYARLDVRPDKVH